MNLTNGGFTVLDDATVNGYGSPLFVLGTFTVMEVVFFSMTHQVWIVLVRERTPRVMAPGMHEVAAGELLAYEAAIQAQRS